MQATLLHVICGECQGVTDTEKGTARDAIRNGLRAGLKATTNKGRKGTPNPLGDGRTEMVKMISAAQRALVKGEESATTVENESLRRWLAGDLPYAEAAETKEIKARRQRMARAVRESQRGAAQLRAAWKREGSRWRRGQ